MLRVLVDSGASNNYISNQAVKNLNLSDEQSNFEKHSHKVQNANKTMLNSLGDVNLDASLNDYLFTSKFNVIYDLLFDIILGMSFLRENRAIIDAEDAEIMIKAPSPLLQATINYSVFVPAYSYSVVTASIPEPVLETHVLNNSSSLGLKYGIYVAQG